MIYAVLFRTPGGSTQTYNIFNAAGDIAVVAERAKQEAFDFSMEIISITVVSRGMQG